MEYNQLSIGQPIRNLQSFLRKIASYYSAIPPVIPDGIYGTQTEASVKAFQRLFLLKINGKVDNETWNKIIEVYKEVIEITSEPKAVNIFPSADYIIEINDESEHLFIIQGMLYNIAQRFNNITQPSINGKHDTMSVQSIKDIQELSGLDINGKINKKTWDTISAIYEIFISKNK